MKIGCHSIFLISLILLGVNSHGATITSEKFGDFYSVSTSVAGNDLHASFESLLVIFMVTNTNNSGAGSLRQAILDANANPGLDEISFSIPGAGPHTINVTSALPNITDRLVINGASEPDFINIPVVRIDGDLSGNTSGLVFSNTSDSSTVSGLMITRFNGNGIQIDPGADVITISGNWIGSTGNGSNSVGNSNNGINVQGANTIIGGTGAYDQNVITNNGNEGINLTGTGATGTLIRGNIIGLDPDGSTGSGNGDVGIAALSGANNTIIGGATVAERNIISMNYEGIEINSRNNVVQGNYVGTDVTGTLDRGNRSDDGIEINSSATGNLIGGASSGTGNLISANAQDGIQLNGPSNTVLGNLIGLDASGTLDLGNGRYGIRVSGVADNIIGGSTVSSRNVISGNNTLGILLAGSNGTVIQGNYIGTDITGSIDIGNGSAGLMLDSNAPGNTIGGSVAGAGNLISGNNNYGVYLVSGCNNNTLQGNTIGLDKAGTSVLGNSNYGIMVSSANNIIGGTTIIERNVVSANNGGIGLSGINATGNVVQGNYIGTDITGTIDLGNTTDGVLITAGATSNTIGGTDAGSGNIISGNNSDGIEINGATSSDNLVEGNYIGTDATGTQALGNSVAGVRPGGNNNTIGGPTAEARNVISGNSSGITIGSTTGLVIEGNYIGTDASATAKIGNTFGLWITSGSNNTIGGTAASAGNVISGNNQRGIYLIGASSNQYLIQGNFIGTNSAGQDLGNGGAGILIASSAFNNQIGGIQMGAGNTIAFNSSDGIWISTDAGTSNAILGNSIYSNSGIGIDLLNDQVTANDAGDIDTGPNDLQNYPLLENATVSDGNTTITGSLNSMADTTFRIEFFSSPIGDASGYGEGQTYLGSTIVNADGSGNATFDTTFNGVTVNEGNVVSATATVDRGNGYYGSTSEFAANVTASLVQADYDNPCNAAELIVAQSCSFEIFNNDDATDSGIPLTECDGYSGGDLWLKVEVPATGNVIAKIETDAIDHFPANDGWAHRLGLAVYKGSCSTLTYDTCWIEPEGPGIPQSPEILLHGYSPGDTLFLRVWEHNNDDKGEFRICVFTDDENPTINCPPDVSSQANPGSCVDSLIIPLPGTGDNYGIESVINDFNGTSDASDLYSVGITSITWTVKDLVGNTAICIQNITITDNEAPEIICPGTTSESIDENCQFIMPDYSSSVTIIDNCDPAPSIAQSPGIGTILSSSGTIQEIVLIGSDEAGNESTCRFNITLMDNTPPEAISLSDTSVIIPEGVFQTSIDMLLPVFTDNCGILSVSNDFNGGTDASGIYPYGTTTVVYTVTDINSNTVSFNQQVHVGFEEEPDHGLVIPEAFSPNEDGLNDRFEILGLEQYPENELQVYNVNGIEVFRMANYDNSWDGIAMGKLNDGNKLPTATYYYVLRIIPGDKLIKGFVYLRRE